MKLIFSSNIAWSIYNFRRNLLLDLQKEGYTVYVVSKEDSYADNLKDLGFKFIPINIENNKINPLKDIKLLFEYIKIYNKIKPNIILHNAIKPNIYGTIAAGVLKIPTINNISGLGTLFIKKSLSTKIAKILYFISQKFSKIVFFQNPDDLNFFVNSKLVEKNKTILIPGSGVDTNYFKNLKENVTEVNNFIFVGRFLKDKGFLELVEAVRKIKYKYPEIFFYLVGAPYKENSTSITTNELNDYIEEGLFHYFGETDDVRKYLQKVDCLILPSYREGLSKVLIEAASMSLPIITTNVPGCKDVVTDEFNGLLCKVKDADDLYLQIEKMINCKSDVIKEMSLNSRKVAVEKFDINIVNKIYLNEISKLLKN